MISIMVYEVPGSCYRNGKRRFYVDVWGNKDIEHLTKEDAHKQANAIRKALGMKKRGK